MNAAADDTPRYRHEAIGVVLRVDVSESPARLTVLASKRQRPPHKGRWTLPSGALDTTETLGASVARHLRRKVDLDDIAHLEQLETRSDPTRDPAQRTVATAYLGLVPCSSEPTLPRHAAWLPVDDLPPMGFDHSSIVASAVERLRAKLSYANLGFALAPPTFTLTQLREVYEAALGHNVAVTNLQRVLERRGQLVDTGEVGRSTSSGGRPARIFRFAERTAVITDPFAILKPGATSAS